MQSMTSNYFVRESRKSNLTPPGCSAALYTQDSAARGAARLAQGSLATAFYRHLIAPRDAAPDRPMVAVVHRAAEEAGGCS
jgi:hypothetical protein